MVMLVQKTELNPDLHVTVNVGGVITEVSVEHLILAMASTNDRVWRPRSRPLFEEPRRNGQG